MKFKSETKATHWSIRRLEKIFVYICLFNFARSAHTCILRWNTFVIIKCVSQPICKIKIGLRSWQSHKGNRPEKWLYDEIWILHMNSIHFAHPFIPQSVTEFQNFRDSTQHSWSEINENNFLIANVVLMKIPRVETRKCLPFPGTDRMKAIQMAGCTVGRAQIDFIYFSIFFSIFRGFAVCELHCYRSVTTKQKEFFVVEIRLGKVSFLRWQYTSKSKSTEVQTKKSTQHRTKQRERVREKNVRKISVGNNATNEPTDDDKTAKLKRDEREKKKQQQREQCAVQRRKRKNNGGSRQYKNWKRAKFRIGWRRHKKKKNNFCGNGEQCTAQLTSHSHITVPVFVCERIHSIGIDHISWFRFCPLICVCARAGVYASVLCGFHIDVFQLMPSLRHRFLLHCVALLLPLLLVSRRVPLDSFTNSASNT